MSGRLDGVLWKLLEGSPEEWAKFAVGLIVIGFLFWLVVRMSGQLRGDATPSASDQFLLTQFRELRQEGDLSEEEYRSIKGRLVDRLSDEESKANSDD